MAIFQKIQLKGNEKLKGILGIAGLGLLLLGIFIGVIADLALIGVAIQVGIGGLGCLIAALAIKTHYVESSRVGITVHNGRTKSFLKWKDVDRFEVRDENFIIMDEERVYRIALEHFKPGQVEELRSLLRSGLGRKGELGFGLGDQSSQNFGQEQEEDYF